MKSVRYIQIEVIDVFHVMNSVKYIQKGVNDVFH